MLERIDLFVEVPVEPKQVERLWQPSEPQSDARASVAAARALRGGPLNARIAPEAVRLEPAGERLLTDAATRWSLSARAVHRTIRVARTAADLNGTAAVGAEAIAEALSFRHETL